MHLIVIVGTRPEAIKLASVVRALRDGDGATVTVVDTGQHDELAARALHALGLDVDVRIPITRVDHSLNELTGELLRGIDAVLTDAGAAADVDAVLVQGDTTSALVGALAAFHRGIPVGHVEAGLRTGDPHTPFPEEANRRMITALARWHFAPTALARDNLLAEGVPPDAVVVSGNTIVDELHRAIARGAVPMEDRAVDAASSGPARRSMIVTLHRRESLGAPLEAVLRAVAEIAAEHTELDVWFPMHANPRVRDPARATLGGHPRVTLVDAADHPTFLRRLHAADLVLTDSGGVTEEATELGVRTLIVRDRTERPEAVLSGVAEIVGTDEDAIVEAVARALAAPPPPRGSGVFGDGRASERIAHALRAALRPASGVELHEDRVVVED